MPSIHYLDTIKDKRAEASLQQAALDEADNHDDIIAAVDRVTAEVTAAIDRKSTTVTVANVPKSIATPDVQQVVSAIEQLRSDISAQDTVDTVMHGLLTNLLAAVNKLPTTIEKTEFPSTIAVSNQPDYSKAFQEVIKAVKAIKLTYTAPDITVKPADVTVATDFSAVEKKLDVLTTAVKAISIVVPESDDSNVISAVEKVSKAIANLRFPVPNYVLPYADSDGKATQVVLNNGAIPVTSGVVTERYDYADPTTIYVGQATLGTSDTATNWTVYKYDLTDSSDASGKVAVNIAWTNRSAGAYV